MSKSVQFKNIGVIFAGGVGSRMGNTDKPKQFLEIDDKPIIIHTLEKFQNCDLIDGIVISILEDYVEYMWKLVNHFKIDKVKWIVPGGDTGQLSIYNGLKKIISDSSVSKDAIVLIHDGVRPVIDSELIEENIEVTRKKGNAITVVPATETIVEMDFDLEIKNILTRDRIYYARAPQTFYLKELYNLHLKEIEKSNFNNIDSSSLMMKYNKKLHYVIGKASNIKITNYEDYYTFEALYLLENNKLERI